MQQLLSSLNAKCPAALQRDLPLHVVAVAGRVLERSPCGAECCGSTWTTGTLNWQSRRLQRWQIEGKKRKDPPCQAGLQQNTSVLDSGSLSLLGWFKAAADRIGRQLGLTTQWLMRRLL